MRSSREALERERMRRELGEMAKLESSVWVGEVMRKVERCFIVDVLGGVRLRSRWRESCRSCNMGGFKLQARNIYTRRFGLDLLVSGGRLWCFN